MTAGAVHVLGVRHHGPGSARAVAEALAHLRPEAVLIEGAPELDAVAALAADPDMVPPVAGLVYAVAEPRRAAFYPMASFSPEWVALRWALAAGVPARFCDLPAAHALVLEQPGSGPPGSGPPGSGPADSGPADSGPAGSGPAGSGPAGAGPPAGRRVRDDPIGALAAAAGYDDPERWWEDVIEHRYHGAGLFDAVAEAMGALRAAAAGGDGAGGPGEAGDAGDAGDEHNERREAAMRRAIRASLAAGAGRVAVVCGAWHAPALLPGAFPPQKADAARLKGLPKLKVAATWVPWTSGLLARRSGYGAGVDSPGWYLHLSTARRLPGPAEDADRSAGPTRFLVKAARLLRERGHDVSPAATVDAVRLADGLAALRGRPGPGLSEVMDAAEAALAGGSPVPLRLVAQELLVGHDIGSVPDATPMVPLARDLAAQQKRLRMPAQAAVKVLELDLRNQTHRQRSQLLHRLNLLGIDWGEPADPGRTKGTFKEAWALRWHPSYSVALVEASAAGTTIEAAATATLAGRAAATADPGELAGLVEAALTAELPAALVSVTETLAARAAEQRDTLRLMAAVEPLARTRRYGNVRQIDTEAVAPVLASLVTRVSIGLPAAVSALDDHGAAGVHRLVDSVDRAVGLLDDPTLRRPWFGALGTVAGLGGAHGLVAGRAVRILLDSGVLDGDDVRRRLSLALSLADDAPHGAAWLEGFLAGDASLLLHDHALLGVADQWISEVRGGVFDDLLPVLRRTFATFSAPDRRALGAHLRRLEAGHGRDPALDEDLDGARADRVVPRILELLGVRP